MAVAAALDKSAFFADVGYEPHPGQVKVHDSSAARRVCACGVRWGKTTAAAHEGIAAALEPKPRGSVGWVVAPTYDLSDRVFREVIRLAFEKLHHRVVQLKQSERLLRIVNMAGGISEIRGKSADNPVSLLGEGLDWLIVDEASRVKANVWEGHLTQRLVDKDGWALLISTPKGRGWFFNAWQLGTRDDPDYDSWNSPSWDNPMLNRAFIERERGRLPERIFAQEYGAQFVEGAGAVFRNVADCATGVFQEHNDGLYYYAGVDLAKTQDYTVLVIVDGQRRVVFADRFHRIDWKLQRTRIVNALQAYGNPEIYVDTTGKGEPIYEALATAGCNVQPYLFSNRSKAALVDNLALLFENQDLVIPRREVFPELVAELEAFQYSVTPGGNTKTGAPSGAHDDCVIALALAMWPLAPSAVEDTVEDLFL